MELLFSSASDLLKMDFQPKCIAVGPGGYALAVCIGQVILSAVSLADRLNSLKRCQIIWPSPSLVPGQLVLMKDKKKCFTLENLGFEPESAALHPGGGTAAVGGAVSGPVKRETLSLT